MEKEREKQVYLAKLNEQAERNDGNTKSLLVVFLRIFFIVRSLSVIVELCFLALRFILLSEYVRLLKTKWCLSWFSVLVSLESISWWTVLVIWII